MDISYINYFGYSYGSVVREYLVMRVLHTKLPEHLVIDRINQHIDEAKEDRPVFSIYLSTEEMREYLRYKKLNVDKELNQNKILRRGLMHRGVRILMEPV